MLAFPKFGARVKEYTESDVLTLDIYIYIYGEPWQADGKAGTAAASHFGMPISLSTGNSSIGYSSIRKTLPLNLFETDWICEMWVYPDAPIDDTVGIIFRIYADDIKSNLQLWDSKTYGEGFIRIISKH